MSWRRTRLRRRNAVKPRPGLSVIAIAGRTVRRSGCPGLSRSPAEARLKDPEGFQSGVGRCYSGGNRRHRMTIRSAAVDRLAVLQAHGAIRHDWSRPEIRALFELPFPELMFCAQSTHYETGIKAEKLMSLPAVLTEARAARDAGASRFCMGAAWREPKERDLDKVCAMVEGVHALGLETCATLGMLTAEQAARLKAAGLDYYNHNLDTSPEFYGEIISTRTYQERLDTLGHVREAGINVCCGGIVGMGEAREDRVGMIAALANLPVHPESVPINMLVKVEGTPLDDGARLDPLEFVRTIAVARITMPRSVVRLSAGREDMSEETQALCFLAGANSIFYGPKLLTTPNPGRDRDMQLLDKLGMQPMR